MIRTFLATASVAALAIAAPAADDAALAEAAALYGQAAEAGHTRSAVSLGMLYQNGRGVAQDFARARALYEGPAAAGDARAQNNLGLLYVRGHGVPQDYDRAAQLFAGAAEQGLRTAMTNLGVMYENGFGVPQSDAEAARLYRLGGAGETREAATFVYDPRLAPPPSEPQEIAALRDAARTGDPVAAFQKGLAHRIPLIIGTNHDEASIFRLMKSPLMPVTSETVSEMFRAIAADHEDLQSLTVQ